MKGATNEVKVRQRGFTPVNTVIVEVRIQDGRVVSITFLTGRTGSQDQFENPTPNNGTELCTRVVIKLVSLNYEI